MNTPEKYGPDRATFRHWLDKFPRPIIGAAETLRECRKRYGLPNAGTIKAYGQHVYAWQIGFDRFAITVFSRKNK